ncbi:MAG: hypothetical protein J6N72_01750, partial [Psychrobacter sp.]|nr:hypothetical protein [Psychrobacter sp.]
SSTLDPKLLQEVQRDTKALNEKMDTQFKQSIKAGDLELPRQEVGRLGLYMDKTSNELKELDKNSPAATNANTASTTPSL